MAEIERRRARRFTLSLPVSIRQDEAEVAGVTRDVSSNGAYIYLESLKAEEGATLEFILELPREITLAEPLRVLCKAQVLRVDQQSEGRLGMGLHIQKYDFLGSS